MRRRIIPIAMFLLLFFRGSWAQLSPEGIPPSVLTQSLREVAGKSATIQWETLSIDPSARNQFRRLLPDTQAVYLGKVSGERQLEMFIATAKGKVEHFVFAVYFRPDTEEIWDVDILEYREAYGGEIDYRAFRRQFRGKKQPKEIVFRRTIRNISGATISARSVTKRVREVLALYRYLKTQQKEALR